MFDNPSVAAQIAKSIRQIVGDTKYINENLGKINSSTVRANAAFEKMVGHTSDAALHLAAIVDSLREAGTPAANLATSTRNIASAARRAARAAEDLARSTTGASTASSLLADSADDAAEATTTHSIAALAVTRHTRATGEAVKELTGLQVLWKVALGATAVTALAILDVFGKLQREGLAFNQSLIVTKQSMHNITDLWRSGVIASIQDMNLATVNISRGLGDIRNVSSKLVESALELSAVYNISDVSAAKITSQLYRWNGRQAEATKSALKYTVALSKLNGAIPGDVIEEMARNTDSLARFANKGAEGFARQVIALSKMGVEMRSISAVGDRLVDDFEGTLESAAKLQTFMPGFDMSEMQFAAQFGNNEQLATAIQTSLQRSGIGSLSNLPRSLQNALSKSLGLSLTEIENLLKNTTSSTKVIDDLSLIEKEKDSKTETRVQSLLNKGADIIHALTGGFGGILAYLIGRDASSSILKYFKRLGGAAVGTEAAAGAATGAGSAGIKSLLTKLITGPAPRALARAGGVLSGALGGYEAYKIAKNSNKDKFEIAGDMLVQGGLAAAGTAIGALGGPLGMIVGGFLGNTIGKAINHWLPGVGKSFADIFKGFSDGFGIATKLLTSLSSLWSGIKNLGSSLSTLMNVFTGVNDASVKLWPIFEGLGKLIGGVLGAALSGFVFAVDKIVTVLTLGIQLLSDWGSVGGTLKKLVGISPEMEKFGMSAGFKVALGSVLKFHEGGIVGKDKIGSGSLKNLKSNESVAILQHGEVVFTAAQMASMGRMIGGSFTGNLNTITSNLVSTFTAGTSGIVKNIQTTLGSQNGIISKVSSLLSDGGSIGKTIESKLTNVSSTIKKSIGGSSLVSKGLNFLGLGGDKGTKASSTTSSLISKGLNFLGLGGKNNKTPSTTSSLISKGLNFLGLGGDKGTKAPSTSSLVSKVSGVAKNIGTPSSGILSSAKKLISSKASSLVSKIPGVGGLLGGVLKGGGTKNIAGSLAKTGAGKAIGMALGSVIPGAGTIVGGLLGSVGGKLVGKLANSKIGKTVIGGASKLLGKTPLGSVAKKALGFASKLGGLFGKKKKPTAVEPTSADVMQNNTFGDGGLNSMVDSGLTSDPNQLTQPMNTQSMNTSALERKFDELISLMKSGGIAVNLDGRKISSGIMEATRYG